MSQIKVMRQVLKALEYPTDQPRPIFDTEAAILALRKAIEQAEKMEPYAYAVYFPDQPKIELCHELDELCDDMTNREHEVTPLYTHPPAAPAQLYVFDERT